MQWGYPLEGGSHKHEERRETDYHTGMTAQGRQILRTFGFEKQTVQI